MNLLTNIRQECHTMIDRLSDDQIIELWDILKACEVEPTNTSASQVFGGLEAQSEQLQEGQH